MEDYLKAKKWDFSINDLSSFDELFENNEVVYSDEDKSNGKFIYF